MILEKIEEAIEKIDNLLSEEEADILKEYDYNNLCDLHFSLGLKIRNILLETDSDVVEMFLKCGVKSKDDMSMLLIQIYYVYMKNI